MHLQLTVHSGCLDPPPHLKHHTSAASSLFMAPFLKFYSLLLRSCPISVFLTALPRLDRHRWVRLCHIKDRWITRGNACSTTGQCRFPWSHKQTRSLTTFWHHIPPDWVYIYCYGWMSSLQASLLTDQCSTCKKKKAQLCFSSRVKRQWDVIPKEEGIWRATSSQ